MLTDHTRTMLISYALAAGCMLMLGAGQASAVEPEQLIAQHRDISGLSQRADPLVEQLRSEVAKILAADAPLAPFRTMYGEGGLRYHWREPWQTVYTLSLAYPYLDDAMQAEVRSYLREDIAERPPWSLQLLGPAGTLRQPTDQPRRLFDASVQPGEVNSPFFAYALWVYADRVGDWEPIEANWNDIRRNFAQLWSENLTLEHLSGAIGLARLAEHMDDEATADAARRRVAEVMELDFETLRRNATRVHTGRDDWDRPTRGVLHAHLHLTPEAARWIDESPALTEPAEAYAAQGRYYWPLWWMAQGPVGHGGYYGEGNSLGPEINEMLFNYEAWVADVAPAQLRRWVDVPDALIGDYTYIRKLVTAIEAQGESRWTQPE